LSRKGSRILSQSTAESFSITAEGWHYPGRAGCSAGVGPLHVHPVAGFTQREDVQLCFIFLFFTLQATGLFLECEGHLSHRTSN